MYRLRWHIGPVTEKSYPPRRIATLMLTLTDVQMVTLRVQAVDRVGNPATLSSGLTWTSSDTTVLAVNPSTDGMSCQAVPTGKLGTAQVLADAQVSGNDVKGTLDVQVVASDAINLTISADAPVDNPSPPNPPTGS